MAIYYVSNNGNDSNLGTDTGNTFKTISKINTLTLYPGDSVLFKRGDIWREQLKFQYVVGSSGNTVTIGDYGSGNKPILCGSIDGDVGGYWINIGGNKWASPNGSFTNEPFAILYNSNASPQFCLRKTGSTYLNTNWDFCYDSVIKRVIVYNSVGSPDIQSNGIEIFGVFNLDNYGTVLNIQSCDFLEIKNLDIRYSNNNYINSYQSNNITISDCEGRYSWNKGFDLCGNYNILKNNYLYNTGYVSKILNLSAESIFMRGVVGTNYSHNGSVIRNNEIELSYDDGIGIFCSDNIVINDNYIHVVDSYIDSENYGIYFDSSSNSICKYNIISNFTNGFGIICETSGLTCSGNTIHNNVSVNNTTGYATNSQSTYKSTYKNYFYNNTSYNDVSGGISVKIGNNVSETIFKNNIFYDVSNSGTYMLYDTSSFEIVLDYNCWYSSDITRYIWNNTNYNTYNAYKTASGQDSHSIVSNPLFLSPGSDFRLQPNSPCINFGVDVGLFYNGKYPDIGSNEYLTNYISDYGNDIIGNGSWKNPWESLSYACSQVALTGSTIFVKSGTYLESNNCILPIGVSIVGEGNSSIIKGTYDVGIPTYDYSKATISLSSTNPGTIGNQKISNIYLDGVGLSGSRGISIKNRSNVEIENCTIIDFKIGGVLFYNDYIYTLSTGMTYEKNNKIHDCVIDNCSGQAGTLYGNGLILMSSQQDMLIYNNILLENRRVIEFENGNIINAGGNNFKNVKYYNNKSYKPDYIDPSGNTSPNGVWNFHLEIWGNMGGFEIFNNEFYGGDIAIDCGGHDSSQGIYDYSWSIHDNKFEPFDIINNPRNSNKNWIVVECLTTYKTSIYKNSFYGGYYGVSIYPRNGGDISIYENIFAKTLYSTNIHDTVGVSDTFGNIYIYRNLIQCEYNSGYYYGTIRTNVRGNSTIENIHIYNNTIVSDSLIHNSAIEFIVGGTSGNIPITGGTLNNINIKNNIMCYHTNGGNIKITNNGSINGLHIENNLFYNIGNTNIYYTWPYNVGTITNYTYSNNVPSSIGGSQQNPLFINSSDFRLQSNSPAINAGQDIGLDYIGSLPDIGSFEFGSIYFDNEFGDDDGFGTILSPYKSIPKLNNIMSSSPTGTTFYLKRGSVWSGTGSTINITNSGVFGNPIEIKPYGNGENPKLSGFINLTGWTNEGNGIFSKSVNCETTPNFITIDGLQYGMGRYPNIGTDLIYESFNSNVSITSSSLNSSIINWTGAEVYIRKNEFIADRCKITNHTNQTLTYTNLGTQTNATSGYYFFIQNDLRCVTQFGEWYYNSGSTKLYVYFGTNDPENYTIKIPTVSQLLISHSKSYINISGITFEGTCSGKDYEGGGIEPAAVFIDGSSSYHTIKYCNFDFCGSNGITIQSSNSSVLYNNIDHIVRCAIESISNFATIENNNIKNVQIVEGTSYCSSRTGGIINWGNDSSIKYNNLVGFGQNSINFWGSRVIIKNNYISNWSINMNVSSAIYTDNSTPGYVERTIEGNILIGGYGKVGISTYGQSIFGIYLDSYSDNVLVKDNTISDVSHSSIYISNGSNINLQHNTTYNSPRGIFFLEWSSSNSISNIIMNNNIFFSKNSTDISLSFESDFGTIGNFGTSDYNYFVRPINDNNIISTLEKPLNGTTWQNRTLSNWQSYTNQDLHSNKSPVSISNTNQLIFQYNTGLTNLNLPLIGIYKDVSGITYTNSVTISPYSSIILMETSGIYFDSINGNDSWSGTTTYPYKSLSKLNSLMGTSPTGTTFYLKRGSEWTGSTITPPKSGTINGSIKIGTYGTGEKPIISGFQTITGWQFESNGIYSKSISAGTTPNVVSFDDVNRHLGRYPKTTYRTIDSHIGNTTIVDSETISSNINWTGSQIVIRKNNWTWHRFPVTNHSGSTITYSGSGLEPTNGLGFYFQQDLRCLTELGDWAFIGGKIYMYFGSENPNSHSVKISTIDRLIDLTSKSYISIDGLKLIGCTSDAIYSTGTRNTINDCNISFIGNNGIQGWFNSSYLTVSNCEIYECHNRGIYCVEAYANFKNNYIYNIGTRRGMALTNDNGAYSGINLQSGGAVVDNGIIEYNVLNNIGYNAISFGDNNSIVRYNYVSNYCSILNDGAGIYTGGNATTGRQIYNNICIGAPMTSSLEGTSETLATIEGIYLDTSASDVIVRNNTCAYNNTSGIFLHGSTNSSIYDNVCYGNVRTQLLLTHDAYVTQLTNNNVQNNQFFSPSNIASNKILMHEESNATNSLSSFGVMNNNYYCKPLLETTIVITVLNGSTSYRTLDQWKSYSGLDSNSKSSPISISGSSDILFEFNSGLTPKTISLTGKYVKLDGSLVTNSIIIDPFSSIILLKSSSPSNNLLILDLNGRIRLSNDSRLYLTI